MVAAAAKEAAQEADKAQGEAQDSARAEEAVAAATTAQPAARARRVGVTGRPRGRDRRGARGPPPGRRGRPRRLWLRPAPVDAEEDDAEVEPEGGVAVPVAPAGNEARGAGDANGQSKAELQRRAASLGIDGRSTMSKAKNARHQRRAGVELSR